MIIQRPVDVRRILPWTVTNLGVEPFPGMWAFNPSIHFDGAAWRCAIRCADYAMPNGVTVRGELASPAYVKNRNIMVELDPDTWQACSLAEMIEADDHPRITGCTYIGFADLRLFMTEQHGIQAIAAGLALGRPLDDHWPATRKKTRRGQGVSHPAEQVILSFDDESQIVKASPIRGGWSGRPQKNWSPFDRATRPMFLYSIDRGIMFDHDGPTTPDGAMVSNFEGGFSRATYRSGSTTSGTGGFHELRGGTQLVHIGGMLQSLVGEVAGGVWLSLAHDMRIERGRKFYWHVLYAIDSTGRMLAQSDPFKLAEQGIEFAAGLAIDGNRAVISFGVDDAECRIGATTVSALLGLLRVVP